MRGTSLDYAVRIIARECARCRRTQCPARLSNAFL